MLGHRRSKTFTFSYDAELLFFQLLPAHYYYFFFFTSHLLTPWQGEAGRCNVSANSDLMKTDARKWWISKGENRQLQLTKGSVFQANGRLGENIKTFPTTSHKGIRSVFRGAALVAVKHISLVPEPLKAASDLCQFPIRDSVSWSTLLSIHTQRTQI